MYSVPSSVPARILIFCDDISRFERSAAEAALQRLRFDCSSAGRARLLVGPCVGDRLIFHRAGLRHGCDALASISGAALVFCPAFGMKGEGAVGTRHDHLAANNSRLADRADFAGAFGSRFSRRRGLLCFYFCHKVSQQGPLLSCESAKKSKHQLRGERDQQELSAFLFPLNHPDDSHDAGDATAKNSKGNLCARQIFILIARFAPALLKGTVGFRLVFPAKLAFLRLGQIAAEKPGQDSSRLLCRWCRSRGQLQIGSAIDVRAAASSFLTGLMHRGLATRTVKDVVAQVDRSLASGADSSRQSFVCLHPFGKRRSITGASRSGCANRMGHWWRRWGRWHHTGLHHRRVATRTQLFGSEWYDHFTASFAFNLFRHS